ncbi:unnamed protein product [Dracunculus medinensis]|uniref:Transposase n=1 Tax=Dracunculus medinensis TaxID=318479 RepID=A0A0N4UBW1_DRAME|nr:unnamed protein product [Dracunculus medinensis]
MTNYPNHGLLRQQSTMSSKPVERNWKKATLRAVRLQYCAFAKRACKTYSLQRNKERLQQKSPDGILRFHNVE